ncbi:MAG: HEAT repeat domain-containing protein [Elusimicrobiota bacterium]
MNKTKKILLVILVFLGGVAGFLFWNEQRTPLVDRLISSDDMTRNTALQKMNKLPLDKKQILVSSLLEKLNDTNPISKRFAIYSLRKSGISDQNVLLALISRLGDDDASVREEVAVSLQEFGKPSIPLLIKTVDSSQALQKSGSVDILKKMGKEALPDILNALTQTGSKLELVKLIRSIEPSAFEAVPPLKTLLRDSDLETKVEAALAIHKMEPSFLGVTPAFMEFLEKNANNQKLVETSSQVLTALQSLGADAHHMSSALSKLLLKAEDGYGDDFYLRSRLAQVLLKIDRRREQPIDIAFDLKQKNSVLRYRAAWRAGNIEPARLGDLAALTERMSDTDLFVAARAFYALQKIGLVKTERMSNVLYPQFLTLFRKVGEHPQIHGFKEMAAPQLAALGRPLMELLLKNVASSKLSVRDAYLISQYSSPTFIDTFEKSISSPSKEVRVVASLTLIGFKPDHVKAKEVVQAYIGSHPIDGSEWMEETLKKLSVQ